MNSPVLFMRYEPSRIEIAGSSEVEEGMIWAAWNVLHTDSSPLWFAFSMILCIRSRKLVICPVFSLLGRQSECLFWSPFAQHHLVGFLFLFLFSRRMFVVKDLTVICFVLSFLMFRMFPPAESFLPELSISYQKFSFVWTTGVQTLNGLGLICSWTGPVTIKFNQL